MTVEVVWVTPDAEKHLAYIARVSNPDNQETGDASKLIAYLIKHKHWSPFEMVSVCLEVNTARDIGRQALRHNPRVQEFSQRYQTVDKLDGFVYREFRKQDKKNRQKSIDVPEDDPRHLQWKAQQEKVIRACSEAYEWCIANGGAKEVAHRNTRNFYRVLHRQEKACLGSLVYAHLENIFTIESDGTAVHDVLGVTSNCVGQGRLTRTVGAHDGVGFTRVDL